MMEYINKLDLKGKLDAKGEAWSIKNNKDNSWGWSHPWAYMALSPKKMSKHTEKKSAHPYWYWLNPHNQQHVNFGWYTVEEIEQWLDEKGPIPKDNWRDLFDENPKPKTKTIEKQIDDSKKKLNNIREGVKLKTTR